MAQQKPMQLGTMRLQVRSLAFLGGLRIWHCLELWCRSKMWLRSGIAVVWRRPAAVALVGPLTWKSPYVAGAALKKKKKGKKIKPLCKQVRAPCL